MDISELNNEQYKAIVDIVNDMTTADLVAMYIAPMEKDELFGAMGWDLPENMVTIPKNVYGIEPGEHNFMTLRAEYKDRADVLGYILDMLEK